MGKTVGLTWFTHRGTIQKEQTGESKTGRQRGGKQKNEGNTEKKRKGRKKEGTAKHDSVLTSFFIRRPFHSSPHEIP
jgi:hypothetical protein